MSRYGRDKSTPIERVEKYIKARTGMRGLDPDEINTVHRNDDEATLSLKDIHELLQAAKELAALRNKGVLIVGSGNMVHNLGLVAWNRLNESFAFDWALEASDRMKSYMLSQDFTRMVQYQDQGTAFRMAIPTPEHYYPLLYALALKEEQDALSFFNDKPVAGALTMTSVAIGQL